MTREAVILVTLALYKAVLVGIGWFAERRNRGQADFLLGGRGLGPLVAAISASASSSSVWTLLGVSGLAYQSGLFAIWLFPACVGGFALNWFLLARRMRAASHKDGSLTVTEFLAGPHRGPGFAPVRLLATAIVVFSLTAYVAAQFDGAGKSFASNFDMSEDTAVIVGALIVVIYTVLGGFWAVSLTDTLQGLMMAATAVALPVAGWFAIGGLEGLQEGIAQVATEQPGYDSMLGDRDATSGALAVLALCGITLGYPGQPHVVNRFMALADDRATKRARTYAMTWAALVYAGMILLGLCARILPNVQATDSEAAFFGAMNELFPPLVAGIGLAAVLSAIMSTADSQLLVAGSAVSHDAGWRMRNPLIQSRLVVVVISAIAVVVALTGDDKIFNSVLFAWTALGAGFGPLLVMTVCRGRIGPLPSFLSMALGSGSAILLHNLPLTELGADGANAARRVGPFVLAFAVLLTARSPQRP